MKSFNEFDSIDLSDLYENSLYATPAEKDELLQSKDRLTTAFVYNFLGMLGLINATHPGQRRQILNFLKTDKSLRITNIGDDNHDISLIVKLVQEADLFRNPVTVHEITRFLVRLKSGLITHIDSKIVAKWVNALKPDFHLHIKDQKLRQAFLDFKADGGETMDVSQLAILLKKRANKTGDSGDFGRFAKRFPGLKAIDPSTTSVTATSDGDGTSATSTPTTPVQATPSPTTTIAPFGRVVPPTTSAARSLTADADAIRRQRAEAERKAEEERKRIEAQRLERERAAAEAARKAEEERKRIEAEKELIDEDTAKVLFEFVLDQVLRGFFRPDTDESIIKMKINKHSKTITKNMIEYTSKLIAAFHVLSSNSVGSQDLKDMVKKLSELGKYTKKSFNIDDVISLFLNKKIASNWNMGNLFSAYFNAGFTEKKDDIIRYIFTTEDVVDYFLPNISEEHIQYVAKNDYVYKYITHGFFEKTQYMSAGSKTFEQYMQILMYSGKSVQDSVSAIEGKVDSFKHHKIAIYTFFKSYSGRATYLKPSVIKFYEDMMAHMLSSYDEVANYVLEVAIKEYNIDSISTHLKVILSGLFLDEVYTKGIENSKLADVLKITIPFTHVSLHKIKRLSSIGFDYDKYLRNHPNSNDAKIMYGIENGIEDIDSSVLLPFVKGDYLSIAIQNTNNFASTCKGDSEKNINKMYSVLLDFLEENSDNTKYHVNNSNDGVTITHRLPKLSKEIIVRLVKYAKKTDSKMLLSSKLYESMSRREDKRRFLDTMAGVIQDIAGTEAEEYFDEQLENMPSSAVNEIRNRLIGVSMLIDEIESGAIKPFDKIDSSRMKQILLYNDMDLTKLLRGKTVRKKKGESYVQFFARAKKEIAGEQGILGEAKVKENPDANKKEINKIMIERDHAGRHGDTYPKILKVFDASLEFPEFEEFRKNNYGDGTVVPAYHGTGGIAASMILRYGFTVIKSSDPSVVGRMLGDGIYFSNKIDKVLQYVGNSGYSRQHGQKGYVMEMDVTLGRENVDYQSAGVKRNDGIRSPEWCVRDPRKQIKVVKVYEVELTSKKNIDKILYEEYAGKFKRFGKFLREERENEMGNITGFIFRDGMIPIVDMDDEIKYVDFEEAVKKNLISAQMLDKTSQGPMVVFTNTSDYKIVDMRYADLMGGDDLDLYRNLFKQQVLGPTINT